MCTSQPEAGWPPVSGISPSRVIILIPDRQQPEPPLRPAALMWVEGGGWRLEGAAGKSPKQPSWQISDQISLLKGNRSLAQNIRAHVGRTNIKCPVYPEPKQSPGKVHLEAPATTQGHPGHPCECPGALAALCYGNRCLFESAQLALGTQGSHLNFWRCIALVRPFAHWVAKQAPS